METIVNWLTHIELTASIFYRDAAVCFKDDEKLAEFLNRLSTDERWHYQVMMNAAECVRRKNPEPPFVVLDSIKSKVEGVFQEGRNLLLDKKLTKKDLVDCLVKIEFAECNDIFLYVVNSLREESREFMDVAAKIRDHLKQIERFVESMPGCQEHLALIRKIPRVWKEKILIVEDMDYIAEFFKAVLSSEGSVEIASDGAEGLRKISETHFDVIVSDVDMPLVSGIEFYERAAQYDQKIGERFLFLSGDLTDQRRDFFLRNNLEFAAKPVSIDELRRRVAAIMKNNMKHF